VDGLSRFYVGGVQIFIILGCLLLMGFPSFCLEYQK
jgi:hypothetical protein